jgi:hypothetical protein
MHVSLYITYSIFCDNWIGYVQGYMHLLKPNTDSWIGYVQGYMHLLKRNIDNPIQLSVLALSKCMYSYT